MIPLIDLRGVLAQQFGMVLFIQGAGFGGSARFQFMVSDQLNGEHLQCPILSDRKSFASILQPGGFITLVQMKEVQGIIGRGAFRAGLDGPMNPVLGPIGVAEIQEEPAEMSGIEGIAGIGRTCLSEPSDRFAVLP